MRKVSNQQNCGSTVGCYGSVGVNTEHKKVTASRIWCCLKLSFFGHAIIDGGCELVKRVIQGKVSGKRRRGAHKTAYSSSRSLGAVSNSDVGGHGSPLLPVSCSFDDLDFTDF